MICEAHRPLIKRRLNFSPEEIGDARERDLIIWTVMNSPQVVKEKGMWLYGEGVHPHSTGRTFALGSRIWS